MIQTLIPAILSVGLQCIEISDESSTAELYEQIEVLSLIVITFSTAGYLFLNIEEYRKYL